MISLCLQVAKKYPHGGSAIHLSKEQGAIAMFTFANFFIHRKIKDHYQVNILSLCFFLELIRPFPGPEVYGKSPPYEKQRQFSFTLHWSHALHFTMLHLQHLRRLRLYDSLPIQHGQPKMLMHMKHQLSQ